MSLEYVILGFLEVGPKTGYDLKKRFDRSVAGFWPADQSRIYRTLTTYCSIGGRGWVCWAWGRLSGSKSASTNGVCASIALSMRESCEHWCWE